MTAFASTIVYGALEFPIGEPEITRRRDALDSVMRMWQSASADTFAPNAPMPGFTTVWLDEVQTVEEIPGMAYEHRLRGKGLLGGKDRIIASSFEQGEEGWDTSTQVIYTLKPELYQLKRVHPLIDSLYAVDVQKEVEIGGVTRVSLGCKGIIPVDGVPKGYKRTISVSSATLQTAEGTEVLVLQPSGSYALDTVPKKYNFSSPSVQVVDSFLSFEAPPTAGIPGNWIPPDPPAVRTKLTDITLLDPVVLPSGAIQDQAINVPNGWVLEALNSERLLDLDIWLTTITARFVRDWDIKI